MNHKIRSILNRAKSLNINGEPYGMLITLADYKDLGELANQRIQHNRKSEFTYNLDEPETGLVQLLCWYNENTPWAFDAPKNVRLSGRMPEALHKAMQALANDTGKASSPYSDSRFENIRFFDDQRNLKGIMFTLENGAELVRIAKEYYSK